jgi:hypothetical protein
MSEYEHHAKAHDEADESKDDVEAHKHRWQSEEPAKDEGDEPDVEAHKHRWQSEEPAKDEGDEPDVEAHRHRGN